MFKDIKVGSLITIEGKGYFLVTQLEQRRLKPLKNAVPIVHYIKVGGKKERSCHVSYCELVTHETISTEYKKSLLKLTNKTIQMLGLLEKLND